VHTWEVLERRTLGRWEEGVVVRMKGRRRQLVAVVFLRVMIWWRLLHLEQEVWGEEGGRGGRHAIAGHWPHREGAWGVFEREREEWGGNGNMTNRVVVATRKKRKRKRAHIEIE
jgi:hypothetical protein